MKEKCGLSHFSFMDELIAIFFLKVRCLDISIQMKLFGPVAKGEFEIMQLMITVNCYER